MLAVALSTAPCSLRGLITWMTTAPTKATGSATAANDSIPISTPRSRAIPAMMRFELVQISVTDPASVVT